MHYARAAIQRECSTDWLLFTDDAIESDYRSELEDSEIGQDHRGDDYAKVFREVEIDAGRMDCAKRILEVINRRKGVRFDAGLYIETHGELGSFVFDPISSSIRAYSPRPTFDSI